MRPQNLKTRIFLDSGSAEETREALNILGFLDGQTTNPTYFAKSQKVQERLEKQGKFTLQELLESYKETVQAVSKLIPGGDVSIEVYADKNSTAEEMLAQARDMYAWIPNAHIKFPTILEGLNAAEQALKEGIRVNMTVCFSQEQAAAVYAATKGAKKGDVFVSPFVGRLHDRGINGIDLIKNIIRMYKTPSSSPPYQGGERGGGGGSHVEVLTASLRSIDHLYAAQALGTDIITVGFKYLKEWKEKGFKVADESFVYEVKDLKPIPYQEISLGKDYRDYNISHELTDIALQQFADDWNALIK